MTATGSARESAVGQVRIARIRASLAERTRALLCRGSAGVAVCCRSLRSSSPRSR